MCGCGTDSRRGRGCCPRYQVLAVMGTSTSSKFFLPLPDNLGDQFSLGEVEKGSRQVTRALAELRNGDIRPTDASLVKVLFYSSVVQSLPGKQVALG